MNGYTDNLLTPMMARPEPYFQRIEYRLVKYPWWVRTLMALTAHRTDFYNVGHE